MEKYFVILKKSQGVEYFIEKSLTEDGGEVLVLKHSTDAIWSSHVRGQVILRAFDNGNGIHVIWEENIQVKTAKTLKTDKNKDKKMFFYNYSQSVEMMIILSFINRADSRESLYEIVKTDSVIEV